MFGRAGDLWLTAGNGLLYHSTDGGGHSREIGSVAAVATLGFGKAAPGAGYPAIYLTGIVGGVQGIFLSTDEGSELGADQRRLRAVRVDRPDDHR